MSYKIPRESWAIIERVIRRYPAEKAEYETAVERLLHSTPENGGQGSGNLQENPVERIAMALNTPRMERIRRETEAVEKAYAQIPEEYRKVIRARFWSDRSRNMPYIWMQATVSYSERQMRRIAARFIENVGKALGEL